MASILLVLTGSPHSSTGQRALALAESLAAQGHTLTLCCLQDAVFLAAGGPVRPQLRRLLEGGARCVALGDDLNMRGLRAMKVISVVDRAAIVSLLAADHDRVIGAL
jgi:sulfur transfer complex TusBCD TusB component (DsrH family)